MIKYKCFYCDEPLEAPSCLEGDKLQCPACKNEHKVPKLKPATEKQLSYARKLGIRFDENITCSEMSLLIDKYKEIRFFLLDVWKTATKKTVNKCNIPPEIINLKVNTIISDENTSNNIYTWRKNQWDRACELSDRAKENHENNRGPEPKDFKAYLPSVKEFSQYKTFAKSLKKLWKQYI